MAIQRCPKCDSVNTYIDGLDLACRMCGKRSPINWQQPVAIKEIIGRKRIMDKSQSGKTGTCLNCERKKFIAAADGLCSTCHKAVRGLAFGMEEYVSALAEVKRRLTSPNNNLSRCGRKASSSKPDSQNSPAKKAIKSIKIAQKNMSPEGGALANLYPVVDRLKIERDYHLAAANKLTKAIEALES